MGRSASDFSDNSAFQFTHSVGNGKMGSFLKIHSKLPKDVTAPGVNLRRKANNNANFKDFEKKSYPSERQPTFPSSSTATEKFAPQEILTTTLPIKRP